MASTTRAYQRSFGGGEIAPEMFGRVDDGKYQNGLAKCQNFLIRPQGVIERRSGTHMVNYAKHNDRAARLITFTYSTDQTMVLELGDHYIRFHTLGATLMASPGAPYEVYTPYTASQVADIHYVQSADVMTFVHPDVPPHELRRLGSLSWELVQVQFTQESGPAGLSATATVASGTGFSSYFYTVSSIDPSTGEESATATPVSVSNNLYTSGNKNTINWTSAGAGFEYFVYKFGNGMYGYIGRTLDNYLVDENIAPDMSRTPPRWDNAFSGAGNYPAAVTYFEQRRSFGGTRNLPQSMWMTRSGSESDMTYNVPVRDDNRVAFRVASREANSIRHLVPLSELLILTSSAEWRLTSINTDAITPTSVSVKPQSYIGSNNVQPVVVNSTVLFGAARGGHLYEMAYNWQASGYVTGDLSLRATHLFDGYEIKDLAYGKAPYPVVWSVRDDGVLLGLTYMPEQQVGAWHRHTTLNGKFRSCTVAAEGPFDILYVLVERVYNGVLTMFVERMAPPAMLREVVPATDAYYVDCGLSRSGAPAQTFTGLGHLNGQWVSVLADGAVHPDVQVIGGSVTLETPASVVHIGFPIDAHAITLPYAQQIDSAAGQGRVKNVNKVWLKVQRSSGISAGPDLDHLKEVKHRTDEPMGSPPSLVTEEVELVIDPSWKQAGGQVVIKAAHPLPLAVRAVTFEVSMGG